jgi:multidrug transporter EmrE-like cation transporter
LADEVTLSGCWLAPPPSWVSFFLLAFAMKYVPAGTAYAVWTGCGAVGAAVAGILLFGESRSALRLASITLIVAGIVGVRMAEEPAQCGATEVPEGAASA